jgi:hypothetical protein
MQLPHHGIEAAADFACVKLIALNIDKPYALLMTVLDKPSNFDPTKWAVAIVIKRDGGLCV